MVKPTLLTWMMIFGVEKIAAKIAAKMHFLLLERGSMCVCVKEMLGICVKFAGFF